MNRLLGWIFESVHMLGMAALFGVAAFVTWMTVPSLLPDTVTVEGAARLAGRISRAVGEPGRNLAIAALIAAVLAPYIRNDRKLKMAWLRIACCAAVIGVMIYAWGDSGPLSETAMIDGDVETKRSAAEALKLRGDEKVTPWNGLLAITALNLVAGAFQMFNAGNVRE